MTGGGGGGGGGGLGGYRLPFLPFFHISMVFGHDFLFSPNIDQQSALLIF